MSEEKRRFKAVIGDKAYTIIGPGSEQHFLTVTKLLNERLDQVKKTCAGSDCRGTGDFSCLQCCF